MKRRKGFPVRLLVSQEAIQDFARLSVSQRLKCLDEMRSFLSHTLPPKTKERFEVLREKGW